MVFSSLIFLYCFLPLCLVAYFLCPSLKSKNICLLVFSLIFYAWGEPVYVFLLAFMAFVSWLGALCISRAKQKAGQKLFLYITVTSNLLILIIFKYAAPVFSLFGNVPPFIKNLALPIGISFYTFQLISYVADVFRHDAKAEKRYWHVLLYASLFHQCIAGPIVRYKTISKELFVNRRCSGNLLDGVGRFSVGLAKKVLLANACGKLCDTYLASGSLESLTALSSWIAVLAYMLQIYLDFSAYSDMAIGMGKMLGLHYAENFNYPYIASSVTDFWHRWHISLSTFFRDYVYIPLGGNRCSVLRNILNLFIVWSLTGLWHGASINFLLWGIYYFVFLVLEKYVLHSFLEKHRIFSHIYLLPVVFFGWILFYFRDFPGALTVVRALFGLNGNTFTDFISTTVAANNIMLLVASAFFSTPCTKNILAKLDGKYGKNRVYESIRFSLVPVLLLFLSTAALVGDSYNPFIYFQF